MAKRTPPTFPAARRQVLALGARLRAARLRRGMTQAELAARVGVAKATLLKLEAGNPATSLATLLRALHVLGLSADIDALAANDPVGVALEDSRRQRARPRKISP